jgi:hypothetical protein
VGFTNELSEEIERLVEGKATKDASLERLEFMEDLLLITSKFFHKTNGAAKGLQYEFDATVQELERLEADMEDDSSANDSSDHYEEESDA